MNTHGIKSRYIHWAVVRAKVISSFSCDPGPTELWRTDPIGRGTTWNNQPRWEERPLSENNKRNNPTHCATDGNAEFDATTAAVKAADGHWDLTTFMFKAKNEDVIDKSWRRFELNPYLQVNFNSFPNPPVHHGMEAWGPNAADALPCRTGNSRPAVATRTPRLRALVSDPDGDLLRDSGFAVHSVPVGNNSWITEPVASNVPSGSYAEVTVPEGKLVEGGVYSWSVYAGDGGLRGVSTGSCEFTIDMVAPKTPLVSSKDYPPTGFNGSVGRTGIFTFSPDGYSGAGDSMDVVRYGWSLNVDTFDNQVNVTAVSGVVEAPITPVIGGTNSLYVKAYDRAGNAGTARKYVFNVADPSSPIAAWNLDETSGNTAADITGKGHPLTLNGATFGSGYANNGQVNTINAFSSTSTPLLNTAHAFSVSAWVKLDNANGYATVVSQDGGVASGFYLEYSDFEDRWSFSTVTTDGNNPGVARALSSASPELGVWTHLLGTYEPNSHKIRLYVNGKPEGTADATAFGTTGQLVVGAAKWNGDRVNWVPGTIDHVQVWDRALSADEAANQNNFAVLRAHYNLDERVGTATKDETTGRNGTLSGGATWAGTPVDPDDPNQILTSKDKWLKFDSSRSGQVAGARPANLRTDRSYTVSAWVRHAGPDGDARAAVGLGGATHSPFLLGYRPEARKWGFTMSTTSGGHGAYALSDMAAEGNKWVHLVGTFDATTGTITLYVNGVKQNTFGGGTSTGTGLRSYNGLGDLWVGRGIWDGNFSDPWKGDVDDARVYSGVLSASEVNILCSATMHL